jgi:hypothetical protein
MSAALLFAVLAIGDAISADDLPPTHMLLLTHLANFADDTGKAWPSVDTLAARTHLARRTVLDCLAELEAAGWIIGERRWVGGREGGRPLTTRYEVRASGGSIARKRTGRHVAEAFDSARGAPFDGAGGAPSEGRNGATGAPFDSARGAPFDGAGGARDGAPRSRNGARGAPDPIRDPIRDPKCDPDPERTRTADACEATSEAARGEAPPGPPAPTLAAELHLEPVSREAVKPLASTKPDRIVELDAGERSPEAAELLVELRRHAVLRAAAEAAPMGAEAALEGLAATLEGRRMVTLKPVAHVAPAIGEAARDLAAAAAGEGAPTWAHVAKTVAKYADRARAPRHELAPAAPGVPAPPRRRAAPPPPAPAAGSVPILFHAPTTTAQGAS